MEQASDPTVSKGSTGPFLPMRFREMVRRLLGQAAKGTQRQLFLKTAGETLFGYLACDYLEISLSERSRITRCRVLRSDQGLTAETWGPAPTAASEPPWRGLVPPDLEAAALKGDLEAAQPFLTRGRTFWTGDSSLPVLLHEKGQGEARPATRSLVLGGDFPSLALIPVPVDASTRGLLQVGSRKRDFFSKQEIQFYEAAGETLGVALAHQGAQWALRERVKELTCLYGIARRTHRSAAPRESLLQECADLLPPGWQYPEIASAQISLDGKTFRTAGFTATPWMQRAPIVVGGALRGEVTVAYSQERPAAEEGPFLREERALLEAVAETLGLAQAERDARWALEERVKELTCLYGIANLARQPEISLDELLQQVVRLLPPGWQYPELTEARITLDERSYATAGYSGSGWKQSAPIFAGGRCRGEVAVAYTMETPSMDEGPFLREERALLNEVARQVGLILERRGAEEERQKLQEQLRHADRLATIGQLAAGAAHELNEPLGNILGFAQLAKACPGLPPQAGQDLDRIVHASLHAREVIKKLMLFGRQVPTQASRVHLNKLLKDGLYFLASRCSREGIRLVWDLDPDLPPIVADPSQIHQVFVNLVVNAIQAMPKGGTLTLASRRREGWAVVTVGDTGVGMAPAVLKQIFVPFYTTKDVGEGTGLGLSVVHGIVTGHGGKIEVESREGGGSRFSVYLPLPSSGGAEEIPS
jgi:signal transduction histidine kinase